MGMNGMKKVSCALAGAGLLLGGALLMPSLSGADAEARDVKNEGAGRSYRTCYLERRFIASGTPRIETNRRCVFGE